MITLRSEQQYHQNPDSRSEIPWGIKLTIVNAFAIRKKIQLMKAPSYPYDLWRFDVDTKEWYTNVKTKKQFEAIVAIISICKSDNDDFSDERGAWVDTHARVKMDIWTDQDDGSEFFVICSDTYLFHDLLKNHSGQWSPNEKVWENVEGSAGPLILRTLAWWGFDVYGVEPVQGPTDRCPVSSRSNTKEEVKYLTFTSLA
eukprot:961292-Rhodomonas_salina.1